MKKADNIGKSFKTILFITFLVGVQVMVAQNYKLSNHEGSIAVTGTSTLHDWEINAETYSGHLAIEMASELPVLSKLELKVEAESLKSGKSLMDSNTYKSLKTDTYPNITFKMLEVKSMEPVISIANQFKATISGNLTVAGSTKKVDIVLNLTHNDGKWKITGKKKLAMTSFNVKPPTVLMGTIKTGNDIEVVFNTFWME